MRNSFFENSHTRYGGEASTSTYNRKSKLSAILDQQPEVL